MELTVIDKRILENGVKVIIVNEVNEGWFGLCELCDKSVMSLDKQGEITDRFRKMWQNEKYKIFSFRIGQRVIFRPGSLSKLWYKNDPSFNKLVVGEYYTITKLAKRRFLFLDGYEINIYWKDVVKA